MYVSLQVLHQSYKASRTHETVAFWNLSQYPHAYMWYIFTFLFQQQVAMPTADACSCTCLRQTFPVVLYPVSVVMHVPLSPPLLIHFLYDTLHFGEQTEEDWKHYKFQIMAHFHLLKDACNSVSLWKTTYTLELVQLFINLILQHGGRAFSFLQTDSPKIISPPSFDFGSLKFQRQILTFICLSNTQEFTDLQG